MTTVLLILAGAGVGLIAVLLAGWRAGRALIARTAGGLPAAGARIRVLYTAGSLDIGGAERVALGLMADIDPTRFQVVLLVRERTSATPVLERSIARAVSRGMPVIRKPTRQPLRRSFPGRLAALLRGLHDAAAELAVYRGIRPDILHCHLVLGFGAQAKKLLARAAGIPIIVSTYHQFPLSHAPSSHRPDRGIVDRVLMRGLDGLTLWTLQHIDDRLIATSPEEAAAHAESGVPAGKIVVISNGIPLDSYREPPPPSVLQALRASLGVPDGAFIFGHLGRMNRQKAQQYLLAAAATVLSEAGDAWLVVAGEGPERGALEQQRRQVADESVRQRMVLTGPVVDADIPTWHFLFDAFVLSSRFEGQGLVNMEAMAAGRPIVATRVGAVASTVGPDSALLVPPEDVPALAAAMHRVVTDPALRRRMGAAGRARAFECFDAARSAGEHEALYQRLVPIPGAHA